MRREINTVSAREFGMIRARRRAEMKTNFSVFLRGTATMVLVTFVCPLLSPRLVAANGLSSAADRVVSSQAHGDGPGPRFSSVGATGQLTRQYSLSLPPAPLMPALALHYNSGAGVSDVGYGWQLGGVRYIERDASRETPVFDVVDDHYRADGIPLVRPVGTTGENLVFEKWGDASRATRPRLPARPPARAAVDSLVLGTGLVDGGLGTALSAIRDVYRDFFIPTLEGFDAQLQAPRMPGH